MRLAGVLDGNTHRISVGGFLVEDGHVRPLEQRDDADDGFHLALVRRHRAQKVLEPFLVAQLGARREEAHLRRAAFRRAALSPSVGSHCGREQ